MIMITIVVLVAVYINSRDLSNHDGLFIKHTVDTIIMVDATVDSNNFLLRICYHFHALWYI